MSKIFVLEDYKKMNAEDINRILTEYKDNLINKGDHDLTEQELGFIHGLEYALSMHEKRPALYVRKDRKYTDYDKKRFPEHFL